MADTYVAMSKNGGGGWRLMNEDLEEADVWAAVNEREDPSSKMRKSDDFSGSSSGAAAAWRISAAPRKILRAHNPSHEAKVVQQSAPVDIPDWSKIYGKPSKKGSRDGSRHDDGVVYDNGDSYEIGSDEEEDDDDNDEMVPPHEWIARKLARNQISSFSVCEGIGRTLKGRDLSKVRNAILTKTGFLE